MRRLYVLLMFLLVLATVKGQNQTFFAMQKMIVQEAADKAAKSKLLQNEKTDSATGKNAFFQPYSHDSGTAGQTPFSFMPDFSVTATAADNTSLLYGFQISPLPADFVSFSPDSPTNPTRMNASFRTEDQIISGEFVNGCLYLLTAESNSSDVFPKSLIRLSTETWEVISSTPVQDLLVDMAYDYTTQTMYGIGIVSDSTSMLCRVNLETGAITSIAGLNRNLLTLSIDKTGGIFAISKDGALYKIDSAKKTLTLVGNTGKSTLYMVQTMTFNRNNGKLYWANIISQNEGGLCEVNTTTGQATAITGNGGTIPRLRCLYVPYYPEPIPVAPTNFTVTPGTNGAKTAALSWKNPAVDRLGNALTRLDAIEITRNGRLVKEYTSGITVGATMNWTDNDFTATSGDYTYSVYGIINGNDGARATKTVQVGIDSCEIIQFPYIQDFENPATTSCLTSRYYSPNKAEVTGSQARSGTHSWQFTSESWNNDGFYEQYLILPRLPLSNSSKTLRFYYNTLGGIMERFSIGYSTVNSNNSSFIWVDYLNPPATYGWEEYFKIFPADTKFIAIRYQSMNKRSVYIDDVTIDTLHARDAEVVAIVAPAIKCELTNKELVMVKVKNMGTTPITSLPLQLKLNNETPITQTFSCNIASLADTIFAFTNQLNLSTPGNYTIQVTAALSGDANAANNSKTLQLINYKDGIRTLPFTEDFENPATLACWTILTDPTYSSKVGTNHRSGAHAWCFNSNNQEYLVTPELATTTGDKAVRLYYFATFENVGATQYFEVGYSLDGKNFTMTPQNQVAASKMNQWIEFNATFPAAAKYIGIHYYTGFNYEKLYIDDISVREVVTNDVGVTELITPRSGGDLTASETVKVRIKNMGAQTINAYIPMKYEIDGVLIGNAQRNTNLAASGEATYEFATKANLSAAKTYTIKAYTDWTSDQARDNDTVTVKVTNYGPCKIDKFPYFESFETPLSGCWSVYDPEGGDGVRWRRSSTIGKTGEWSMEHGQSINNKKGWLVSPRIVLPRDSVFNLSFWSVNGSSGYGKNSVLVSTGSPYPEDGDFVQIASGMGVKSTWEETVISLADYAGKEISLAFLYEGRLSHIWYLDDIRIYKIFGTDAALTAITSPISQGDLSNETVSIRVKNEGASVLSDIPATLVVDNTVVATDTIHGSLKNLEEVAYSFKAKANLSATGDHIVKVYLSVNGDGNTANDTVSVKVTNYGPCPVTTFPYTDGFEKNPNYFVCWTTYDLDNYPACTWKISAGDAIRPHSGNLFADHEDWNSSLRQNDWLVSSKITIPETGIYSLSFWSYIRYADSYAEGKSSVWISEGSPNPRDNKYEQVWTPSLPVTPGWQEMKVNLAKYVGKEIYIAFRYEGAYAHRWYIDDVNIAKLSDFDAGVINVLSPTEGGNASSLVKVEVGNYGAQTLSSLKVAYKINNQPAVEEQFNGLTLKSNETTTLTFTQPANLSAYTDYTVAAYTLLDGDINHSNDTAKISFLYRENIPVYGYQIYEQGSWDNSNMGVVSFKSNTPSVINYASPYKDGNNDVQAGAYADDYIYVFTTANFDGKNFIKLKPDWTEVFKKPIAEFPDDMTYSPVEKKLYAIVGGEILETVNMETGAMTVVHNLSKHLYTLACNAEGVLYGIDSEGYLNTINITTGALTVVGYVGSIPAYLQSMTFELSTGRLFWVAIPYGNLVEINPLTAAIVDFGEVGAGSQITALYVPTAPKLVSQNIEDNGQNIDLLQNITFTFDRLISLSSKSNIKLTKEGNININLTPSTSENKLVIAHPKLADKSNYQLLIPAGTIDRYNQDITLVFSTKDTGLGIVDEKSTTVYPNPSNGIVYVSPVPENSIISVMDLSGRLLETHTVVNATTKLELSLEKGVYFIQIQNKGTKTVHKLIIE